MGNLPANAGDTEPIPRLGGLRMPLSNQAHNILKYIENSKEFLTMWAVSMDIYHIKNGH